ncbi:MAG TPA: type Z 30S ribosomal protein S14 [Nitrospinota bacterium]|nr:type Z 30S ribosomal protein S14 [Nitrospinota bacterium]
MAKKSLVAKQRRKPKFSSRAYHRCRQCGRSRAYLRKFALCRHCFRKYALEGKLPGVTKSSW